MCSKLHFVKTFKISFSRCENANMTFPVCTILCVESYTNKILVSRYHLLPSLDYNQKGSGRMVWRMVGQRMMWRMMGQRMMGWMMWIMVTIIIKVCFKVFMLDNITATVITIPRHHILLIIELITISIPYVASFWISITSLN